MVKITPCIRVKLEWQWKTVPPLLGVTFLLLHTGDLGNVVAKSLYVSSLQWIYPWLNNWNDVQLQNLLSTKDFRPPTGAEYEAFSRHTTFFTHRWTGKYLKATRASHGTRGESNTFSILGLIISFKDREFFFFPCCNTFLHTLVSSLNHLFPHLCRSFKHLIQSSRDACSSAISFAFNCVCASVGRIDNPIRKYNMEEQDRQRIIFSPTYRKASRFPGSTIMQCLDHHSMEFMKIYNPQKDFHGR